MKETITREEMYEKKVLTDGEYNTFADNVGACGDRYLDIVEDYRGVIRWLMEKLYEKNGCTEFVVSHFTIINHLDNITIINHEVDDSYETPLDDISDIQVLNLICESSI
jgi:hypothetical protein